MTLKTHVVPLLLAAMSSSMVTTAEAQLAHTAAQALVIEGEVRLAGEHRVQSLHVRPGAVLYASADLRLLSEGPVVIDGLLLGDPGAERSDGLQHGADVTIESEHSIRVSGAVRSGDGSSGLWRSAPVQVLGSVGLDARLYGTDAVYDRLVDGVLEQALAVGLLEAADLAGTRGGAVRLRAPVAWVDGPVAGGEGGAGGPQGSGGAGGEVVVCGHTFTSAAGRAHGGALYGGRGGRAGDALSGRGPRGGDGGGAYASECVGSTGQSGSGDVPGQTGGVTDCGATGPDGTDAYGGEGGPGGTGGAGTLTGNPVDLKGCVGGTGGVGGAGFGGKGGSGGVGCHNCPDGPGGKGGTSGSGGHGQGGRGGPGGTGGEGIIDPVTFLCGDGGDGGIGGKGGPGIGRKGTSGKKGGRPYGDGGNSSLGGVGTGGVGGNGGDGGDPGYGCGDGFSGGPGGGGESQNGGRGPIGATGDPCPQAEN